MKIITTIILLFLLSGPTNIAWLIMTVHVNAIKCVFRRRTSPDAIQKLFNGCKSKLDPTSAVVFEPRLIRICASLLCRMVTAKFARGFSVATFPVSNRVFARDFTNVTPAGSDMTSSQIRSGHVRNVATRALTSPLGFPASYGESVKCLAS